MNVITKANIRDAFTYHPLSSQAQQMAYDAVKEAMISAGMVILNVVPDGKLQQDALWQLFQTRMTANAAIATAEVRDVYSTRFPTEEVGGMGVATAMEAPVDPRIRRCCRDHDKRHETEIYREKLGVQSSRV